MARNLNTSLRRRPRANPMREFDALPPALRQWLSQARLPWSARSALRIWRRASARHGEDLAAVIAALEQAERSTLLRDIPRIWSEAHPDIDTGSLPVPAASRARSGSSSVNMHRREPR
ncbi:DUF6525 family protein [Limimaricola soesokkakensis]